MIEGSDFRVNFADFTIIFLRKKQKTRTFSYYVRMPIFGGSGKNTHPVRDIQATSQKISFRSKPI